MLFGSLDFGVEVWRFAWAFGLMVWFGYDVDSRFVCSDGANIFESNRGLYNVAVFPSNFGAGKAFRTSLNVMDPTLLFSPSGTAPRETSSPPTNSQTSSGVRTTPSVHPRPATPMASLVPYLEHSISAPVRQSSPAPPRSPRRPPFTPLPDVGRTVACMYVCNTYAPLSQRTGTPF